LSVLHSIFLLLSILQNFVVALQPLTVPRLLKVFVQLALRPLDTAQPQNITNYSTWPSEQRQDARGAENRIPQPPIAGGGQGSRATKSSKPEDRGGQWEEDGIQSPQDSIKDAAGAPKASAPPNHVRRPLPCVRQITLMILQRGARDYWVLGKLSASRAPPDVVMSYLSQCIIATPDCTMGDSRGVAAGVLPRSNRILGFLLNRAPAPAHWRNRRARGGLARGGRGPSGGGGGCTPVPSSAEIACAPAPAPALPLASPARSPDGDCGSQASHMPPASPTPAPAAQTRSQNHLQHPCNKTATYLLHSFVTCLREASCLASTDWLTSLTSPLPADCRPCRQQDILAGQTPFCEPGSCYWDK
jgi:hypothetical protein